LDSFLGVQVLTWTPKLKFNAIQLFREWSYADFPKQHFKINNLVGWASGHHDHDPKSIRPLAHPTWLSRSPSFNLDPYFNATT